LGALGPSVSEGSDPDANEVPLIVTDVIVIVLNSCNGGCFGETPNRQEFKIGTKQSVRQEKNRVLRPGRPPRPLGDSRPAVRSRLL
jgi:hypothetical protein